MNVLHGLTGSVATSLYSKINDKYNSVKRESNTLFNHMYVCTDSARKITDLNSANAKFDEDEWRVFQTEHRVLHIDLVKWADVFVIAPCSANTLAKLANGLCDNLLTCVARAWDFDKPFIVAPAMNVRMMSHPSYKMHVDILQSWGIKIVPPQEKKLFCGDVGLGAMANISDIIDSISSNCV